MDSADLTKIDAAEPRLTPWQIETRRRWARLRDLIDETERDLARASEHDEQTSLEASLRQLKRASLSVWVDARRANLALAGAPSEGRSALIEG